MNWSKWKHEFWQRRFIYLLTLLFLYLTLSPVCGTRPGVQIATALVSALLFGQCCVSIIGTRKPYLFFAIYVCFLVAVGRSLALYDGTFNFITLNFQCWAIFLFAIIAVVMVVGILRDVLSPGEIDGNRIAGAACAYIMIGIIFGNMYLLCTLLNPGSFAWHGSHLSELTSLPLFEKYQLLYYYSFVTMTTLGYGDIIPEAGLTRALSFNEALLGQMYLAVFVARLVGMRMVGMRNSED